MPAELNADLPKLPRPLTGDGYRLVKKLGEGGVGEVFEGEHCSLGHGVAVKILHTDLLSRGRTRQRFLAEARALARIDSDYVVRVIDYGTMDDGRPFTVMELLRGVDMRALLTYEHRVSIARGVRLVQDACRGLAAAHTAGFIHRDLKPENLFVARHPDGSERCKVIDFGVAREVNASPVTTEGTLVGTVRYMTPEQVRGGKVSVRVDVYALGAILYELIVGKPMVQGQNDNIILFRICNEAAPCLIDELPLAPPDLESVLACAVDRDPSKRFASTTDLANALEPFINLPDTPEPRSLASTESFLPTRVESTDDSRPGSRIHLELDGKRGRTRLDDGQLLLEDSDFQLWYYADIKLVRHCIKAPLSSKSFRRMLTRGAELVEEFGANKWLSDDRHHKVLSEADSQWAETVWCGRVLEAGWRYWGIVLPTAAIGKLNMRRFAHKYAQLGVEVRVGHQLEPIFEWLKSIS